MAFLRHCGTARKRPKGKLFLMLKKSEKHIPVIPGGYFRQRCRPPSNIPGEFTALGGVGRRLRGIKKKLEGRKGGGPRGFLKGL